MQRRIRRTTRAPAWIACALAGLALPSAAQLPVEEVGRVELLEHAYDPHWLWSADALTGKLALVDLADGRFLGQIDSGWGMPSILLPRLREELFVPETYYARGTRGARTDVATVYGARTLAPLGEALLPAKRAINPLPSGNAALSDDDRFLAVFNMTPATSLSIVDTDARALTAEIATPGCSLAYAVGARRFAALCADGALLVVELDDAGREASRTRSAPFFDPIADPVTEKAQRWGTRWVFVSFEGFAHVVDFADGAPRFEPRWSLLDDADRADEWRVGGAQHLALHEASGKLYSLVHQGGVDSHKDSGREVWVYDLATRTREARIALANPPLSVMGMPIEPGPAWLSNFLLDALPHFGTDHIAVTQDDAPLLVTGAMWTGGVCVYDARTGELLRRVYTGNMTSQALFTWPRRGRRR